MTLFLSLKTAWCCTVHLHSVGHFLTTSLLYLRYSELCCDKQRYLEMLICSFSSITRRWCLDHTTFYFEFSGIFSVSTAVPRTNVTITLMSPECTLSLFIAVLAGLIFAVFLIFWVLVKLKICKSYEKYL